MGNMEGFQIRTPDQRLRVFISSTIRELALERRAVREAVEGMRLHPVLFELGARPHPPRDLYRAYLEQSDIFIGIYFESYGWVAPEMEISGLEDEFVLSGDKPRLVYVKEPAPGREERLTGLLDRVRPAGTTRIFKEPDELKSLVANDLAVLLAERFTRPARSGQSSGRLKTKVPSAAAPIVGRRREISELTALLTDPEHRLVSMCGPGGVGKSRLAIEVANRLEDRFADGSHFVLLEAVTRPDGVPDAIATSLGLADRLNAVSPADLLIKTLADREVLLVLDNFEHVIDAAPFVGGLLQSCPKVRVLVTTRTVLRLRAEAEYVLEPLDVPREGGGDPGAADSVRLFMERARSTAFAERVEQMKAVEEICRRLDGLPLAIELAAARTSILSPEQIVARLEDRFGFLKGGTADLPERHKTMRDAIAWSVDLLGDDDRGLFRRLAVFSKGFTLEAAASVCDPLGGFDVLETMQNLIENSLVSPVPGGLDPRFKMLESIRRFAMDDLIESGEAAEVLDRHSAHYMGIGLRAATGVRSSHQIETLNLLESDEDNIHSAIERAIETGRVADAVRASWAIWPYWWVRCRHFNGRALMEQLLAGEPAPEPEQARAIAIHGAMSLFLGDHGVAVASLAQAIERLRELDDVEALGFSQVAMGLVASVVQPSDTMPRMHEALACLRRARDPYGVAIALNGLCWMDLQLDLDQEPLEVYKAAADAAQYIGSMVEVAISFANLGRKLAADDPEQAITLLRRAMVLLVETDMPSGISYVVDGLAEVAAARADDLQAARLYGFADSLLELAGSMAATAARDRRDRVLAEIRGRVGGDTTDEAMSGGRSLGLQEGIDDALSACDRYLEFLRRNGDSMSQVRRADPAR